ncbi:MAG: glycine cleavage system protein H [Bacteroidales bacterium]|nr:glycine cleavage system protein H [Bacteroidales bacterium]MCF8456039.1 glycine cleavage system protein H [Bacteroidales bacterium]
MEALNSYYDIFDTKGIEYIIIIAFLLLLIPFWIKLNQSKMVEKISQKLEILTAAILNIPKGIFFCKNHTWAHLEKSGLAKVGLDDFVLKTVGKIHLKTVRKQGDKIRKGDLIGEIIQNNKTLKVFSPITGEIRQLNPIIDEGAEILNENSYEKYWMYDIEPFDWQAETQTYYMANAAMAWSMKELQKLKDFLMVSLAKNSPGQSYFALQEGGELRINPLSDLQEEIWNDFQDEFLNNVS